MTEAALLDDLAAHAFSEELSERHRMRLASGARPFGASPGEYLARTGEPAHAFYLIQSGHVAIGAHLGDRGAVPIQTLGLGDVVGWSWLLPPYEWHFDARAVDTVRGLVFDAAWLREQCEQDYELGYHLLKQLLAVVTSRLGACRIIQMDIYKS
ncbi:MAG: cyclic nucleotide-binding domain-containing protein [Isosphaeraceae bacterium]